MLRFSQKLNDLLRQKHWSQVDLARRCGVNPGNISRWSRGNALPDREALAKLIAAAPAEVAADLLGAWALDSLPDNAETYISIVPNKQTSQTAEELSDLWPAGMNSATKRKFLDFAMLAMRNKDVMEVVDVLHTAAIRLERRAK